jgi:hypothetical protein
MVGNSFIKRREMAIAESILQTGVLVLVAIVFIGYIAVYIGTRQYLRESYESKPSFIVNDSTESQQQAAAAAESKRKWIQKQQAKEEEEGIVLDTVTKPYETTGIYNVDDYEYNLVFQNESDRELSQDLRNKLMSQYPMDWSIQPPSSSQFADGVKESFESTPEVMSTDKKDPYAEISVQNVMPPDTLTVEQEERKILQTYVPKKAGDLKTYNIEDAMALIKKIYDSKGEVADVIRTSENVYEIIGTRRKDEKIVYEETDEQAPTGSLPVQKVGEATITVPPGAVDYNTALDPFYEPSLGSSGRQGKWNYRQWTPGLERMFAPTEPRTNWY